MDNGFFLGCEITKKRQQHNENKINNTVMMIFPSVHIIKIWMFLEMLRALKNHYLVEAVPLQYVAAVKTYGMWQWGIINYKKGDWL